MTERVETVEEFLARGGVIEVLPITPDLVEGRKPFAPHMEVDGKYAAWRNNSND